MSENFNSTGMSDWPDDFQTQAGIDTGLSDAEREPTQPSVRRARELPNLAIGHHHGPSSRRSADEEAINIRSWSVWVRLLCLVRPVIDACGV